MLILTPVNSSKNLAQTLLFPSIYSFAAKPKSINYPKISFSVICSQSQQKYPPFDSLLNSYSKEVRVTIKDKTQFTVTNLHLTASGLKSKTRGKVRDIYDGGGYLVLVTTDRQSAFDRILASIPFKGQNTTYNSRCCFVSTSKNVATAKKCSVFPIEFL
ncbi:hypothetical protein CXB51_015216 [Gossypium anomalum]|uniref:phosphoribosylaminoimidazolesuccinocarboxamide synthase n=1 Tax=Gossypium anomalum TaxID=47600 RepID=A0A8J6CY80_9ROSI|nr:hypothetical protein CXB51_015216 [Gossypium anomalum]